MTDIPKRYTTMTKEISDRMGEVQQVEEEELPTREKIRENSERLYEAIKGTTEACERLVDSICERNEGELPRLMYKGEYLI